MWLGVLAVAVGREQCLFCRRQVATPHPDLGHEDEGQSGRRRDEADELGRREARLRLRLRPRAVEALHVGAEEAAHSRVAVDALPLAPAVLRLGPFGGATMVADPRECLDRGAADAARGEWVELAAHRRRDGLVREAQPLLQLAAREEGGGHLAEPEHLDVAVARPNADVSGQRRGFERAIEVTGQHEVERASAGEPAMTGVLRRALEQLLGTVEPAVRDRRGQPEQMVTTETDGGNHGRSRVAGLDRRRIRTLARLDRQRQLPCPPRRQREELEAIRWQRRPACRRR